MRSAKLQKDDLNYGRAAWILNANDRLFQAWATVEMRDNQGQLIPIDKFEEIMPALIDRAVPIHLEHTNQAVGVVKNYEFATNPKYNKKGLLITGKIYNHFPKDTEAWNGIQNEELGMVSIGGQSGQTPDGNTLWVAMCEVALTAKGANNGATIEAVSMAKSDMKKDAPTWIEDTIMEAYQKFKDEKKTLSYVLRQDSIQEAIVDGYTNQKEIETLVRQEAGMSKGDSEYDKERKEHPTLPEKDVKQIVEDHEAKKSSKKEIAETDLRGITLYTYYTDGTYERRKLTDAEFKEINKSMTKEGGKMEKAFRSPSQAEEKKWASLGFEGQSKVLKVCGEGDSQAGMSLAEIGGSTADCLISEMGGMKKVEYGGDKPTRAYDPAKASMKKDYSAIMAKATTPEERKAAFRTVATELIADFPIEEATKMFIETFPNDAEAMTIFKQVKLDLHKDGGNVEETKKAEVPPAPAKEHEAAETPSKEKQEESAAKGAAAPEQKPPAPEAPNTPPAPETPAAPTAPAAPANPEAPTLEKTLAGITETLAKQGETITKIMEKLSMSDDIKETKPAETEIAPKKDESVKEEKKEEPKPEEKKEAPSEKEEPPTEEKPEEKKKEDMGKAAVSDMKKSIEMSNTTPRPPVKELAFDPTKNDKQATNGKIPTVKDIMNGAKLDTLEYAKNGFSALQS